MNIFTYTIESQDTEKRSIVLCFKAESVMDANFKVMIAVVNYNARYSRKNKHSLQGARLVAYACK